MREIVGEALLDQGFLKRAGRFALCGCGDQLVKGDTGSSVQSRGCGHMLCPRCGRKRGGTASRRVLEWVAYAPHGELWNVCFTQKCEKGEGLTASRRRMAPKLRDWMRWATRHGLTAGMTVHHIVWSTKREGWHYHVHGLLEFDEGRVSVESMQEAWAAEGRKRGEWLRPLWLGEKNQRANGRLLAAGPAIAELQEDTGDPEFWNESSSAIAKVVQYPLRDIAQGVSAWRMGGDPELMKACVLEVLNDAKGWKMRRAWGRWRKPCPEAKAAKEVQAAKELEPGEAGKAVAPTPPAVKPVGKVNQIYKAARRGDLFARECLRGLETNCRNNTDFAKRLVVFVRMGCGEYDSTA